MVELENMRINWKFLRVVFICPVDILFRWICVLMGIDGVNSDKSQNTQELNMKFKYLTWAVESSPLQNIKRIIVCTVFCPFPEVLVDDELKHYREEQYMDLRC